MADLRRAAVDRELARRRQRARGSERDRADRLGAVERDRLDRTQLLPRLRMRPRERQGERLPRVALDGLPPAPPPAALDGLDLPRGDPVRGVDERLVEEAVAARDDVRAAGDRVDEVGVALAAEQEVAAGLAAEERVVAIAAVERDGHEGRRAEYAERRQA